MSKLLVVDGHNLLFQMFFGMPSRISGKDGRPIQGTLGFVGALLKILRMTRPTHILVLFDGEDGSVRRELDPAYKANRPDFSGVPQEENPFSQLKDVQRALDYLGIPYLETQGCETDDMAASYARKLGQVMEVVIASFDSDFFQLVTDRVSVLRYRGKQTLICDPAYVRERFGVSPAQYAQLKAMTGDHGDNISGLPGVGVKTAGQLLQQFGSLSQVVQRAEEIKRGALRQAVWQHRERLMQNYRLILLSGDLPLPLEMEDLLFGGTELTTNQVLQGIGLR